MGVISKGRALKSKILAGKNGLATKIEEAISEWVDDANKKIAEEYREQFGNSPMWSDWVENPIKASKLAEKRQSKSQKRRNSRLFKEYTAGVQKIYNDYWSARYKEIQDLFPWSPNSSGNYKQSDPYKKHYRYKVRNYGRSSDHNGKTIKYTSPALMTGFLKMSIFEAISNDGNDYLDIFNDPLAVGFLFKPENYPVPKGGSMSYVEYFWKKANGGGDAQEIFDLPDKYWRRISSELDTLVKNGIIPSFNIALRDL